MIERGQGLGFALETGEVVGVIRERGRQDFDGDVAVELGVPGAVNLSHPPGAKRRKDFVVAEFVARIQSHRIRAILSLGGASHFWTTGSGGWRPIAKRSKVSGMRVSNSPPGGRP